VGGGIRPLSAAGSGNGSGLTLESAAVLLLGTLALGDVNAALPEAALARGRAATARRRLADILTSEPLSSDPVVPLAPPQQRDISARSLVVDWNEDPASQPVLGGVDLFVPAGSTVAVQGASGAGKSTLVAALLRFLDPRSGTLTLGGTDMSAMLGADVRTVVGLVSDDEHIFATSVRENLRLAAPEATDDALRSALHRVRLGAWLAALPQGLDTWLGESGARMSSGERRRLAMARAVLANQSVLVLDEPAESLDEPTAQAVLGDLFAAWAGRSVILVTHRDDGLDLVDHVLQLDNGRLAELPARGLGPSSAGRSAATVELAGWSG
jgi:ATP-binding cassette subfamily C protein CydCD